MSVGYLDQVSAQDEYVDALRLGPDFDTVHALITVEDNDAFMQFAQGGTGNWMWHTEREWRAIPQGMVIGNVIGVQFRNAVAGAVAKITADLLTPSDPDFQVGTPFASSGESGGGVTGDIVWTAAPTRTGAVLCDGAFYDGTQPAYTPLWAKIGTTYGGTGQSNFAVPDLLDRGMIGAGGNTALGGNDGVAAASRHATRHRHTPHTHTTLGSNQRDTSSPGSNTLGINAGLVTGSADGGSGVGTDPLDGPAYLALNPFILL